MPTVNFYKKRISQLLNNATSLLKPEIAVELLNQLDELLEEYKEKLEKPK